MYVCVCIHIYICIYTSLKYCCRILANACGCRRRYKRLTLFVLRTQAIALVLFARRSVSPPRGPVHHEGVACLPSLGCPSPCCPSTSRPASPSPGCPSSGTPATACRGSSCCDPGSRPARVRCCSGASGGVVVGVVVDVLVVLCCWCCCC